MPPSPVEGSPSPRSSRPSGNTRTSTPILSKEAISAYLRYGYIPAPYTIYEDAWKLPPASILQVSETGTWDSPTQYWDPAAVAVEGVRNPLNGSPEEILDRLEDTLRDAVRRCRVADVPLGVFLSGGIDSSLLTALMQDEQLRDGRDPVRTFTVGFPDHGYDESKHAREVADHLGTDHTEFTVRSSEVRDVIPEIPRIYDEPFADPSQVPTHIVSKLARQEVTVAISGDGGDELFGGYGWHYLEDGLFAQTDKGPRALRKAASRVARVPSPGSWDKASALLEPVLDRFGGQGSLGDNIHLGTHLLEADGPEERYEVLRTVWRNNDEPMNGGPHVDGEPARPADELPLEHATHRFMLRDTVTYLPDDILTKVDRASMAVSLESRAPLLNHDVVEMAWRVPLNMKIRDGQGKYATRQILYRHVPRELVDRPKTGFLMPIDRWLREDLRGWADDLLDPHRLRGQGLLDPDPIRERWEEHQSGERNHDERLWAVLMLQAWLDEHAPDDVTPA